MIRPRSEVVRTGTKRVTISPLPSGRIRSKPPGSSTNPKHRVRAIARGCWTPSTTALERVPPAPDEKESNEHLHDGYSSPERGHPVQPAVAKRRSGHTEPTRRCARDRSPCRQDPGTPQPVRKPRTPAITTGRRSDALVFGRSGCRSHIQNAVQNPTRGGRRRETQGKARKQGDQ